MHGVWSRTRGAFWFACLLAICTEVNPRPLQRVRRENKSADILNSTPLFSSFDNLLGGGKGGQKNGLTGLFSTLTEGLRTFGQVNPSTANAAAATGSKATQPLDLSQFSNNRLSSGVLPGIAPLPVPGFPGPQDVPKIPGVNTIPGLDMFNYLVGSLIPQSVAPTNQLISGSITRLLPKQAANQNFAKDVFRALHPPSADVDVDRMMGRWFQVINSPHVIREACTVSHFGALTNNTYSATFTILKFYREGNPNGPPRFALGYGFKAGDDGQFVLHNSNSADSEPFWVVAAGPLNSFNQYDYAIISNWVRFPVFVVARDPERFKRLHMRGVLQYLEENRYINILTKAFGMISPVDYSQCQYTPTFSTIA